MKKQLLSLGLILAAIFTLTNCSKTEIETPQETKGIPFTIQLNVDTKTTNEGMSTKWATGNQVNVFHAEAGTTTYTDDGAFTVINTTTGIFQGNLSGGFTADYHDWYFFYPYSSYITTPANTTGYLPIGSKSNEVQTQTGKNSKAHLAGSNFPLTCKLTNLHKDICPSGQMQQVASVIEIKVKNSLTDPLDITRVSFEAPVDIVGTYYINFAGDLVTCTPSGAQYVSNTANLNITGVSADAALAPNEVASFYIGIKPFTANTGDSLTIKVNNNLPKGIKLTSPVTFNAGKIKTLNFDYDVAPTPPAGSTVTFDFSTVAGITELGIAQPAHNSGTNIAGTTITKENIELTSTDGTTSTRVWRYNDNYDLRIYKDGGSITLTAPTGGTLTEINFTGSSLGNIGASSTWTGNSNSVTFTATGTARVKTITVTYTTP